LNIQFKKDRLDYRGSFHRPIAHFLIFLRF